MYFDFSSEVKSVIHVTYMSKVSLNKPLLVMLYGFPGSGKTHFANQLTDAVNIAHVHGDRIRFELFENPRYDTAENEIVEHLMNYMTEEFLNAGISVVYDTNAMRMTQRRNLRELARKSKASFIMCWLQIDLESAFARTQRRDRRKADDKYAVSYDKATFDKFVSLMQNPKGEDYVVISGKHTFNTQKSAVMKKLFELGVINPEGVKSPVKPQLVNLVPGGYGGRVDQTRRNIVIR